MNLKRLTRLLELIGLLQSSRGRNANSLAEECGVNRRTIFRDLNTLREAGVPLVFDEDQRHYHIPGTYFLPPTSFTAEEALAMLLLCHELGGERGMPFYKAAQAAAVKLENSLPARLRDQLRAVASAVNIRLPARSKIERLEANGSPEPKARFRDAPLRTGQNENAAASNATVYDVLIAAIGARQCVRIAYDSIDDGQPVSTRLSPYRLLFSRHSWYAIGRSSLHRAVRTFHLGRIRRIELLDDSYTIPRGFSLDRYLGNAWSLIPGKEEYEVVIHFDPLVARNVAEVAWHKTQQTAWLENGRLEFRARVAGLQEIVWWVLGYGEQAEVVAPAELRTLVAEKARRMLSRYETRPIPRVGPVPEGTYT